MAGLPEYAVLDPKLDRMPRARLKELQAARLRNMVRYVYDETPFWRAKLDRACISPDDIKELDDLSRIPFCTKEELQKDQADHPPFGSYAGSHPSRWMKYATTSGTMGTPLRRVFSGRDWRYLLDRFQRNPAVGPGDIVAVLAPTDGMMGPTLSTESAARAGALVVNCGLYDTKTKVRLIRDLRPTLVSGTASYLLHMIEVAAEMGIDLKAWGVRLIASVGEPGGAIAATRQRLADGWGASVNDGYGLTEIFSLGGGCPHSTSIHLCDDMVIAEVVDPETGKPVPRGEPGEVVYTNLIGDTQPLLRYRSRDVARLAADEPCTCGHTGTRLLNSIEGRVDDMIWYRGANIFPTAIEAVVRGFPELGHEFQIVVDGDRALPDLKVRVETRCPEPNRLGLERRMLEALAAALRVRPKLELLAMGTLPRSEGRMKLRRVLDRRRPL
jgi:phenylacetate-CoA ligase